MTTDVRSGDALIGFDGDLRVVLWNEAAEELTGFPADEVIGRPCWDVLCACDLQGSVVCHKSCSEARLVRQGWPVAARELLVKTTTGRRQVTVSTVSVRVDGAEPLFLHILGNGHVATAELAETNGHAAPELTARQQEVLEAIAAGEPAKLVALRLGIAETTVRNHIRVILTSLGCHSQLEAVAEARRHGLVG